MIVVNFKTYKQATGYKAIELARLCKKIEEEIKVRIVAVPQLADLRNCIETGAECWVQHVDGVEQGKFTGWVSREDVEEMGARGTLLNHSEHKLSDEVLKKTMELAGGGAFEICLCCDSPEEAQKWVSLQPDYMAYEPPELIGSKDKSVSSEKPEIITKIVSNVQCPILIGAGVHSAEDVKVGLKLGAKGVLVATDVVLADNPEEELRKLAEAFK